MHEQILRQQLTNMLIERQAHMDITDALDDFPLDQINTRLPGVDYSFWQLLEHMRLCQRDILEYIEAETYRWPTFPDDYWPPITALVDAHGWQETIRQFVADRQRLVDMVNDAQVDLFAPLPHSGDLHHTILREITIIASHNAYHTGEFGIARSALGW